MTSPPPLQAGTYYHIFNRGTNRENVFLEERNYRYFLELYGRHVAPTVDTFAYCLLKNHFHLLIRTCAEEDTTIPAPVSRHAANCTPSQAFCNLLNAYAKAINKGYARTGSLFQHPFGRVIVQSQAHLTQLVRYVHLNPQKHGLIDDYRMWQYSSYRTMASNLPTKLRRDDVLGWFDGMDGFLSKHEIDAIPDPGFVSVVQGDE